MQNIVIAKYSMQLAIALENNNQYNEKRYGTFNEFIHNKNYKR